MAETETKHRKTSYSSLQREDFSVVRTPARIAVYDDLKAPPRVIDVSPDITNNFIENLASTIYDEANKKGSKIPYTVIREISENFIHARFTEIVVSILDNGNTIRFTDQGPGFTDTENAQLPGFTSATEGMKQYIRGVGSGLPTVKDYLNYSDGNLKIENNLENGAVVTISMLENLSSSSAFSDFDKKQSDTKYVEKMTKLSPTLSAREREVLKLFLTEGDLGVTQVKDLLNIPLSSTHKILTSLEQSGLVQRVGNKRRILSDQGFAVASIL